MLKPLGIILATTRVRVGRGDRVTRQSLCPDTLQDFVAEPLTGRKVLLFPATVHSSPVRSGVCFELFVMVFAQCEIEEDVRGGSGREDAG